MFEINFRDKVNSKSTQFEIFKSLKSQIFKRIVIGLIDYITKKLGCN